MEKAERGERERAMPAEKRGADALDSTISKKKKLPSSPLLKTSSRVLDLVENVRRRERIGYLYDYFVKKISWRDSLSTALDPGPVVEVLP